MITTNNTTTEPIQPLLERENRVKLTGDIQTSSLDSPLTVAQGETGTIVSHVNGLVKVKLDFNPLDRYSSEPFELEVLLSQITLIDPHILINPDLKSFIPPLSYDERDKLLGNLRLNGCREPLVIWEEASILLDGHNRFELCTKYGIKYQTVKVSLDSFESAYSWIILNQLGRRNLTPEAMSYLRGKLYNLEKEQGKRKDLTYGHNGHKLEVENLTCDHFDHKLETDNLTCSQNELNLEMTISKKTAEKLAELYKVGSGTIRRDGKFANAVDTLANTVGENVRKSILSRDANLTKKKTLELAKKAEREPDQVKENFVEGRYVYLGPPKEFTPFPYQVGEVVRVIGKNEPQLRGFAGCWAIITAVSEFSGDLKMWNGTATNIHPQQLSSLGYNSSQREAKKRLCERITRIIEQSPEATAMQILSLLGRQREPELTQLEEKILSLLEYEYSVETVQQQFKETKTAEVKSEGIKESEPQVTETNQLSQQSEDKSSQPENNNESELQSPVTKVPLFTRTRPRIDDIPPSREYHDIISLIDFHMNELGWDSEYGKTFLNRTYGKTSRQFLSDDELLEMLHHLRCLYTSDEYYQECQKYTEGQTVYWSGKEYQVSHVREDFNRLVLLSLSGNNLGERYTVHPFEINITNST